jgi:hypothetical protein
VVNWEKERFIIQSLIRTGKIVHFETESV